MWASQTAPERSQSFDAALVKLLRVQIILHNKLPVTAESLLPT